jgi:hypothetical protein
MSEPQKPKFLTTTIDEIHQIMFLLRGDSGLNEGDFRSKHLGTILSYLRETKRESLSNTVAKLALKVGMNARYIKENYLNGIIAYGIVGLEQNCSEWYWIGLNAIETKKGELRKRNEE